LCIVFRLHVFTGEPKQQVLFAELGPQKFPEVPLARYTKKNKLQRLDETEISQKPIKRGLNSSK